MPAILLAVTGLSPSIVTETVWALAQEKPRIIPSRVIFVTTEVGAQKIREQLHTPLPALGGVTAWQALRSALMNSSPSPRASLAKWTGKRAPWSRCRTS